MTTFFLSYTCSAHVYTTVTVRARRGSAARDMVINLLSTGRPILSVIDEVNVDGRDIPAILHLVEKDRKYVLTLEFMLENDNVAVSLEVPIDEVPSEVKSETSRLLAYMKNIMSIILTRL